MAIEVKTDRAAWAAALERATKAATEALAIQIKNDSLDYVPDDGEHILRDSCQIEDTEDGKDLVWRGVYAGYQWFGARADGSYKVKHYTTPGTGSAWVDKAKDAHGEEWQKVTQNAFTEALT